jgi:hypothetical protein
MHFDRLATFDFDTHFPHMKAKLKLSEKERQEWASGERLDLRAAALYLALHNRAAIRTATFDRSPSAPLTDRALPRGIVVLDPPLVDMTDKSRAIDWENWKVATQEELDDENAPWPPSQGVPVIMLLHFLEEVGGSGGKMIGRTELLLPAPDMLLAGFQHPLSHVDSALYIPFMASPSCEHFLVPQHSGLISIFGQGDPGEIGTDALMREKLYCHNGFPAVVRVGDVVCYTPVEAECDIQGQQPVRQGVVVLTYVELSSLFSKTVLRTMLELKVNLEDDVIRAIDGMPDRAAVPMLALWPLLQQPDGSDTALWGDCNLSSCWQHVKKLGPDTFKGLQHVIFSRVLKVFKAHELGRLGPTSGGLVTQEHVIPGSSPPIAVTVPDLVRSKSTLADLLSHPLLAHGVAAFVISVIELDASANREPHFFDHAYKVASEQGFPISTLLTIRAAMNCGMDIPLSRFNSGFPDAPVTPRAWEPAEAAPAASSRNISQRSCAAKATTKIQAMQAGAHALGVARVLKPRGAVAAGGAPAASAAGAVVDNGKSADDEQMAGAEQDDRPSDKLEADESSPPQGGEHEMVASHVVRILAHLTVALGPAPLFCHGTHETSA